MHHVTAPHHWRVWRIQGGCGCRESVFFLIKISRIHPSSRPRAFCNANARHKAVKGGNVVCVSQVVSLIFSQTLLRLQDTASIPSLLFSLFLSCLCFSDVTSVFSTYRERSTEVPVASVWSRASFEHESTCGAFRGGDAGEVWRGRGKARCLEWQIDKSSTPSIRLVAVLSVKRGNGIL